MKILSISKKLAASLLAACVIGAMGIPALASGDVSVQDALDAAWIAGDNALRNGVFRAVATLRNPRNISKTALMNMEREAKLPLTLNADTLTSDGKEVLVRITLVPELAETGLNLEASLTSLRAQKTTELFAKKYQNEIAVISFSQEESFGQAVDICAKLDLSAMDADNLVLYSYSPDTGKFRKLEEPNARVDASGYLRFTTTLADDIIVSDGPLAK